MAGVVTTHVIFALLEKKRLENWAEKGEVNQLPSSLKVASAVPGLFPCTCSISSCFCIAHLP